MHMMYIKALIAIATSVLSLVIAYPMMSFAQFESEAGNQTSSESQVEIPLNFTLKAKGGEKAKEGQENKTVTVNLNIQSGEGRNPTKVPVTAEVPNNTKMQLCGAMKEGKEMCQSLKDLMPKETQSSSASSEKSSNGSNNATDNGKNNDNGK